MSKNETLYVRTTVFTGTQTLASHSKLGLPMKIHQPSARKDWHASHIAARFTWHASEGAANLEKIGTPPTWQPGLLGTLVRWQPTFTRLAHLSNGSQVYIWLLSICSQQTCNPITQWHIRFFLQATCLMDASLVI